MNIYIDRWHAYGYRTPTNYRSIHWKHIDDIFLSNKSDGLFVLRLRFVHSNLNSIIITRLCCIALLLLLLLLALPLPLRICSRSLAHSLIQFHAPSDQNDWIIIKTAQSVGLILPLTRNRMRCVCMRFGDQTLQCKIMTKSKKNIRNEKKTYNEIRAYSTRATIQFFR